MICIPNVNYNNNKNYNEKSVETNEFSYFSYK